MVRYEKEDVRAAFPPVKHEAPALATFIAKASPPATQQVAGLANTAKHHQNVCVELDRLLVKIAADHRRKYAR